MQVPFIQLRYEPGFQERVKTLWEQALSNSAFIGGLAVKKFTQEILEYTKAQYFIPCANGTDAMQIALRACGIGANDLVLLPDFTFWATCEAVINVGAKPVMVDISPIDYQMDFALCQQAINKYQPKAIILVHLYGWCSSQLADFRALCKQKNIYRFWSLTTELQQQ